MVHVDADAYETGLEAVRATVDVARPGRGARLRRHERERRPGQGGRERRRDRPRSSPSWRRSPTAAPSPGRSRSRPCRREVEHGRGRGARRRGRDVPVAPAHAAPARHERRALARRRLAAMLAVNTGDDADLYPLTFDNSKAKERLHELFAYAETPPQDARDRRPRGGRHHGAAEQGRHRPRHGAAGRRPRRRRLRRRPPSGRRRPAPRPPGALERRRREHGSVVAGLAVHDLLRPVERGAPDEHRPRGQARRRHHRAARRDLLAQRDHGAAQRQPRLRLRPGDRRRRRPAAGGGGRHLPVRDDALQRRLLRRAPGGRAPRPRPAHLALPRGPRRDRELGRPGLQVQERHGAAR